jgi:hypothetical protein
MTNEKVAECIRVLQDEWGYKVKVGKTVGSGSTNYFSGTDEERLNDFQQMLDDAEVQAILCARGGYGMGRIIDKVNFTRQGTTSLAPTPTDCSLAKIDGLLAANGYVDKNIFVTWAPSFCLMNVQIYQDGKLLRENQAGDASGTVNMSGIPSGTIEIKIWVPGAGNPSDSRIIQIQ